MALAPNKRFIYAQLRGEPYPVSTFSIDHTSGKLTHVEHGAAGRPDGLHQCRQDPGSTCSAPPTSAPRSPAIRSMRCYTVEEKATQIIDTQPKAHCVFIDAANKYVYVPVLGADHIMQFKFDAATGTLTPNDPPVVNDQSGRRPAPLHDPPERQVGLSDHRDHRDDRRLCDRQGQGDADRDRLRRHRRLQRQGLRPPPPTSTSRPTANFSTAPCAPPAPCTATRSTPTRAR